MKEKENKSSNINFRVTQENRERLEKEAQAKGMTLSRFLDFMIEKHFEPKLVKKTSEVIKEEIYDKTKVRVVLIIVSVASFLGLIWLYLKNKTTKNRPPNYPIYPS